MTEVRCAACGRPIPTRYLRVYATGGEPICLPCMRMAESKLVRRFEVAVAEFRRVFGQVELDGDDRGGTGMPEKLAGKNLSIERTIGILRGFPDGHGVSEDGKQEIFAALLDAGALLPPESD